MFKNIVFKTSKCLTGLCNSVCTTVLESPSTYTQLSILVHTDYWWHLGELIFTDTSATHSNISFM